MKKRKLTPAEVAATKQAGAAAGDRITQTIVAALGPPPYPPEIQRQIKEAFAAASARILDDLRKGRL